MSGESKEKNDLEPNIDFHGAAVVDEEGNEIEITESMVRKAIHELEPEAYPDVEDDQAGKDSAD